MSVIETLSPGLLTTVQDLGRYGFGPLGISPSGAADAISLRIGNRLVGNSESAAVLEMTLTGGAFRFPQAAVIAFSGSDFGATLDGEPLQMWQTAEIHAGQTVRIGATRSGSRCYLCVQGGILVEPFLGSASTHILTGLGGFHGRSLRSGDVLQIPLPSGEFRKRSVNLELLQQLSPRKTLRVTTGPQSDWFSESTLKTFCSSAYRVSEESNRMGLRLIGESIAPNTPREMITEGVSLGALQVPANGQPIILFVEQQTTGGYPKIANVISADFHSLGQLRPRDEIRFELVDFETARALLIAQENLIASHKLIIE